LFLFFFGWCFIDEVRIDYDDEVENVGAWGNFHLKKNCCCYFFSIFPPPGSIILYYFQSSSKGYFHHFKWTKCQTM